MTDTPKFTVVDRRKFRADEDFSEATSPAPAPEATEAAARPAPGPRLVEPIQHEAAKPSPSKFEPSGPVLSVAEPSEDNIEEGLEEGQLPPAPTAEEARFQKIAYDQAAERLDDLVRAQNPGAPAPEKIGFEHLVQQLYLSAMMQMGAGTPEGQRPRIDILGARQTIDLLNVVLARTQGDLSSSESRTLETVLFELRVTFLELTRMISAQPQPPMPPPPGSNFGPKR
jgi:hypothetical protein